MPSCGPSPIRTRTPPRARLPGPGRRRQPRWRGTDMALKTKIDIDFEGIKEQFIGLNGRHPGLWPSLPKSLLLAGIFALIVAFAYFFYWKGLVEELDAGRAKEVQLKEQYRDKMRQAV